MEEMGDFTDASELERQKRKLLEYLLEEEGIQLSKPETIARRESGNRSPLSFAQQRLWFLHQLEPDSPAYNIPWAVRITGSLNLRALELSFNEIICRHEVLRTYFDCVEGEPVQIALPEISQVLKVTDLSPFPKSEREREVMRRVADEARQPFDLSDAPLVRLHLLQLGADEHALLLTMHHIISDGWSMGVFMREVASLYEAYSNGKPSPLAPLPIQYADFARWQREYFQTGALEKSAQYWMAQLCGNLPVLQLPTDYPRPAVHSYLGGYETLLLPKELSDELKELGGAEGGTLFMVLLGAFDVLLYRYSGQQDIIVGTPIANRSREELEPLIGFFVNTLVMRVKLEGGATFRDVIREVREAAIGAYEHQEFPFEKVVEGLGPERDLSHTPLFQVMFVLQNTPDPKIDFASLKLTSIKGGSGTAKFDLTLSVDDLDRGLGVTLEYNADLFNGETIRRMLGHFKTLLDAAAVNPDERISRLPLLSKAERSLLLRQQNHPRTEYAGRHRIHEVFERQADRTPEAVAVICGDQRLCYREVNERANNLAHHLQGLGVGPESLAGICMERSAELVVAIIGVLKAGGGYVPLDPAYPRERLEWMLEDAGVEVVITQEALLDRLGGRGERTICIDRDRASLETESCRNPRSSVLPDHPAYVIYTSGSTGSPKGVVVTHYNVVRLFHATSSWFNFGESDVWTLFHSYSFDFSVWEIWGALFYGGRVVIVPYWISRSPEAFYDLLHAEQVTVLNQTPSAFRQLIEFEQSPGALKELALRLVIFGGEALDLQSLRPWFDRHGDISPEMVNMYGITETTVHVTHRRIRADDLSRATKSVIGGAVPDLQAYVLDQDQQPVPVGVAGELSIGGEGIARGYLNRPELTAERFIPNPFSTRPGARLYRSGDLARHLADGDIEYLGRIDHQVKIRGFRIEPGEIEAALCAHPAVREGVVLAQNEKAGENHLIAYVVANQDSAFSISELRGFMKEKLPDYMIPSAFITLDKLPLTAHGKIDRNSLPAPDPSRREPGQGFVAPRTSIEETLASVWADALGVSKVGIDDNYFALGGDSIRSIRVRAKARERGIDFSLQHLFQYQTIRELAARTEILPSSDARDDDSQAFGLICESDRLRLPYDAEDAYPLSQLQAGMVFHSQYSEDYIVYITSFHLRMALDIEKLQTALDQMVSRHEILRTSFDMTNFSERLQLVHRAARILITLEDLRHLSHLEQESYLANWVRELAREKFDWTEYPLARFHIHRRGEDSIQMTLSEPFLDGWSVASFYTELFERYFALVNGKPLPLEPALGARYRDFVALEQEAMRSEQCKAYWAAALGDSVASRFARWPREQGARDSEVLHLDAEVPEEVSDRLKRLALSSGVSLKSVLLAAHMKVVSLLSGQADVFTGMLINGRPEKTDGERVLGTFLNTVPFRLRVGPGTWADLAKQAFDAENELLPYRRYPIQDLQRVYGAEKLFDAAFNYTHFHVFDRLRGVSGIEVISHNGSEQTYYPLTAQFHVDNLSSRVKLALDYRSAELSEAQVKDIARYYTSVLTAMASDPLAHHESLCFLSPEEQRHVIYEFNITSARFSDESCAHHLFEARVRQEPDRVAVVFESEKLSYGELNRRANQLASRLRKFGVGPETLVGICMDRSPDMVVGVLGVLKAGGAYLPLDPDYPTERLAFMLTDSGTKVVLTQERLAQRLSAFNITNICLDSGWAEIALEDDADFTAPATPDNLAYVIYTSGSTGKPKGVLITHRGVVNVIETSIRKFQISKDSRVIQLASLSFDASVLEIFSALLGGAALHLVSREIVASGPDLALVLSDQSITAMAIPPSLLEQITAGDYPALRTIVVGGEACGADTAGRWSRGRKLFNAYAPTEATIYGTLMECPEGLRQVPPIGRPIANMQVYLLDEYMQPVPMAVAGELYLGGEGIARGYLDRPQLTAERFIPDPFSNRQGGRLYRTGDLARLSADGNIEFLGRTDEQVKVRGYRIELGEVEIAVGGHRGVREAVVVAREWGGEKRLVCYVAADEEAGGLSAGELREYVRMKLPDYMLPSAFVFLERFPLGPTGKVERNRLPSPEGIRPELARVYLEPRTPMEEMLAGMWSELLGIDQVGVEDDFFELGGHSLLATQAVSRIRQAFRVEMPLRVLFEKPTIAEMSRQINEAIKARQALEVPPIERASRNEYLPLSFAQQRLWFLDQFEPGSPLYNIQAAVGTEGKLNVAALERSIKEIVGRHEILRTTFSMPAGQPIQVIHEESDWAIPIVDLAKDGGSGQEADKLGAQEAQRPFDLMRGPLLRAILLKLGEESYRLLLTMHHIISDGWSMGVFMREVASLYEAYSNGKPSQLAPLPIQYADFARWQREWLDGQALERQLDYWKMQLAGSSAVLKLPTDRRRPPVQTYAGAHEPFRVTRAVSNALKNIGRREGATLFMTMLAAFDALLYRYSGQEDIIVGTPIANRSREELEPLIGFFVNTLVMRVKLEGGATFRDVIRRVRGAAIGAYEHQEFPFEKMVEGLGPERDLSHTPLFQVMFDLQNAPMPALELPGLRLTPLEVEGKTAKFDLTLTVVECEEGLTGSLEYNTDLFEPRTIKRMLEHFNNLIGDAVARPDESISRLTLLTGAEAEQLLITWNNTYVDHPAELPIHNLFERQAERIPEAMAVICGDQWLSYRELNERANKLAHHLKRLGVGPESRVGICIERSPEMIVAVMGILKAGGTYVPLDPAYPKERLTYMLADAGINVAVTQERLLEQTVGACARAVCLDRGWYEVEGEASCNPNICVSSGNAAYVIYTSGSTGMPKGVVVSHYNLAHSTQARFHYYKDAVTAFLLLSSISFDSSVAGLFWTLSKEGGKLVIPEEGIHRDPALLVGLIARLGISHLLCLPSLYAILLKEGNQQQFAAMRTVIVAGEACPVELLDQHNKVISHTKLFNEYGPTEASVWATVYDCQQHKSRTPVAIGRPIANTQIYVLDRNLQIVPVGVHGELYLGGEGIARGYLDRPQLTAERFMPNPFANHPGARLYRTGDVARLRTDGNIEFMGRADEQVKVRGFRIEPGEVEAAIGSHRGVREAVVVGREGAGGKVLVCYAVMREGAEGIGAGELREYVRGKLPDYMRPSAFVFLDALPLTPSGKLDRLALPAPVKGRSQLAASDEPRSAVERVLAEVWAEVLGVERVGVEENFFEMGGHSLMATRVVTRVREVMEVEVGVKAMFEEPTVRGLARLLMGEGKQGARVERTAQLLLRLSELSDEDAGRLLEEQGI